jgi:hypothetical protein
MIWHSFGDRLEVKRRHFFSGIATFSIHWFSMYCMKTKHILTMVLLAVSAPLSFAGDSKHTAEYVLANSAEYEGKEVVLDVSFVKPVKWKSPIPELAFFHAITIDRRDKKMGGGVLVAVKAADAGSFAKKYGMDFDGRRDSDSLRGVFLAAPGRGPDSRARARIWFVDTTGTAVELIKAKKLELTDDGPDGGRERGERRVRTSGPEAE